MYFYAAFLLWFYFSLARKVGSVFFVFKLVYTKNWGSLPFSLYLACSAIWIIYFISLYCLTVCQFCLNCFCWFCCCVSYCSVMECIYLWNFTVLFYKMFMYFWNALKVTHDFCQIIVIDSKCTSFSKSEPMGIWVALWATQVRVKTFSLQLRFQSFLPLHCINKGKLFRKYIYI